MANGEEKQEHREEQKKGDISKEVRKGTFLKSFDTPPLLLLTAGRKSDSLSWLTYGEARQQAREGDSKVARGARETARKCEKKDVKIEGTNRMIC
jgi:hypothetical protein